VKIVVFDNQVDAALKQLKKQMLKDGLFQEMKKRQHYEKPSVKRKRKSAQARKKRRKALKRMNQHESD
jgi:small subunit ribosomal protein S21